MSLSPTLDARRYPLVVCSAKKTLVQYQVQNWYMGIGNQKKNDDDDDQWRLKLNDLGFNFVQEERNEQIVPNNRNITPSTS